MLFLSPLGSKVTAIGALMAALERNLPSCTWSRSGIAAVRAVSRGDGSRYRSRMVGTVTCMRKPRKLALGGGRDMHSPKKPKILGTGLLALDVVVGADPNAPLRFWAGGTCGNVLAILAYLGWDAYPIARLNGDVASRRVRADLSHWGVHLDWTSCAPTSPTPIVVHIMRVNRMGGRIIGFLGHARTVGGGYRGIERLL